jgi:hypothetical protein
LGSARECVECVAALGGDGAVRSCLVGWGAPAPQHSCQSARTGVAVKQRRQRWRVEATRVQRMRSRRFLTGRRPDALGRTVGYPGPPGRLARPLTHAVRARSSRVASRPKHEQHSLPPIFLSGDEFVGHQVGAVRGGRLSVAVDLGHLGVVALEATDHGLHRGHWGVLPGLPFRT